jgi:hypothetical protein
MDDGRPTGLSSRSARVRSGQPSAERLSGIRRSGTARPHEEPGLEFHATLDRREEQFRFS